jgi:hypothetical protein
MGVRVDYKLGIDTYKPQTSEENKTSDPTTRGFVLK